LEQHPGLLAQGHTSEKIINSLVYAQRRILVVLRSCLDAAHCRSCRCCAFVHTLILSQRAGESPTGLVTMTAPLSMISSDISAPLLWLAARMIIDFTIFWFLGLNFDLGIDVNVVERDQLVAPAIGMEDAVLVHSSGDGVHHEGCKKKGARRRRRLVASAVELR